MDFKNMNPEQRLHEAKRTLLMKCIETFDKTGQTDYRLRHKYYKLADHSVRNRFAPVRPLTLPGLVNHWRRAYGEDSGLNIYIFNTTDENAVMDALSTITDVDGWRPNVSYDCSGQSIGGSVDIKVIGANRILATQWTGLDV